MQTSLSAVCAFVDQQRDGILLPTLCGDSKVVGKVKIGHSDSVLRFSAAG